MTDQEKIKDSIQNIEHYFKYDNNNSSYYIILYKGNPIKLRSGKSSWSKIAYAKSALSNHIRSCSYRHVRNEVFNEIMKNIEFKEIKLK